MSNDFKIIQVENSVVLHNLFQMCFLASVTNEASNFYIVYSYSMKLYTNQVVHKKERLVLLCEKGMKLFNFEFITPLLGLYS